MTISKSRLSPFQHFIEQCCGNDLSALLSGDLAISCNDKGYQLDQTGVKVTAFEVDQHDLKANLIQRERVILDELYQTYPLCRTEFDYQANKLFEKTNPAGFCHHLNNENRLALMIEANKLIVVDHHDARYQYGYYSEKQTALNQADASLASRKWLESGDAYEDYRVKTHCRYTCR